MRFKFVFVVLLVGFFTTNCGGGTQLSPTAPSTTLPVQQEPGPPPTFSFVRVGVAGSSWDLPVWGLRGDNSEDAVKQMVFCDAEGGTLGSQSPNVGLRTLSRLVGSTTIVIREVDWTDEQVVLIRKVSQEIETITGLKMVVDTKVVLGNRVGLVLDPTITHSGEIDLYSPRVGGPITTADIRIRSATSSANLEYVVRHELGHLIGLCHHNFSGVMGTTNASVFRSFLPVELDNAVIMYKLPVTTPFPGQRSLSSFLSSGFSNNQKITIYD